MASFDDKVKAALVAAGGAAPAVAETPEAAHERLAPLRSADPVRGLVRFFLKYRQFEGRAGRLEWMWGVVFFAAVLWWCTTVDEQAESGLWLLSIAMSVGLLLPLCAVSVRRCHDAGKPGGLILAAVLPVMITQALVVWVLVSRPDGVNAHGPERA